MKVSFNLKKKKKKKNQEKTIYSFDVPAAVTKHKVSHHFHGTAEGGSSTIC